MDFRNGLNDNLFQVKFNNLQQKFGEVSILLFKQQK